MEIETFAQYSNKVSIFISQSEAILTFMENQPRYNDADSVTGMDTTKKSTIFMSLSSFKSLLETGNALMKQVENEPTKESK